MHVHTCIHLCTHMGHTYTRECTLCTHTWKVKRNKLVKIGHQCYLHSPYRKEQSIIAVLFIMAGIQDMLKEKHIQEFFMFSSVLWNFLWRTDFHFYMTEICRQSRAPNTPITKVGMNPWMVNHTSQLAGPSNVTTHAHRFPNESQKHS